MSSQCGKEEFQIFELPPTQVEVLESTYQEIRPLTNPTGSQVIDFSVKSQGELYTSLSDIKLCITARICKADGAVYTAEQSAEYAPCNFFLGALISKIDVYFSGRLASGASDLAGYNAYLQTLLSYGKATKKSQLGTSLWIEDADKAENFKKRSELSKQSRHMQLMGRLLVDVFTTNKLLLNGVNLDIRITRAKDNFCIDLTEASNLAPKVEILDAYLLVKRVKPSSSVFTRHQQILQSTNAKYPYRRVVSKIVSIPQGSQSIHLDSLYTGTIPSRVIIGLIPHTSYVGNYKSPPFDFKHYDLNFLTLNVNSRQFPAKPLTPDFENNRYSDAYMTLFRGLGIEDRDSGHGITLKEYKDNSCTLYAFDLTNDACGDASHLNLLTTGALRLEAKFAKPIPNNLIVFAYGEVESLFEIDGFRNLIME